MPRYKNISDDTIVYRGIGWAPGEDRQVPFFVPVEELQLTSEDPKPSPVLLSQEISVEPGKDKKISIDYPKKGKNIEVSAIAISGSGVIKVGESEIILDQKSNLVMRHPWSLIAQLTIASQSGGVFRVLAEEVSC